MSKVRDYLESLGMGGGISPEFCYGLEAELEEAKRELAALKAGKEASTAVDPVAYRWKGHTPGPWSCHSGMVWKLDGSEDGYPIAMMNRNTPMTTPCERDSNAHLIAMAPELLRENEELKGKNEVLKSACAVALRRFGDQNSQVTGKVWDDNYAAVHALEEALYPPKETVEG